MNQNINYTYSDPRVNQQQSQNQMHASLQNLPTVYQSYPNTTYTTSTSAPNGYGGGATFIPNNGTIFQVQQGRVPQTIRLQPSQEQEEKATISNMSMDGYFMEPSTSSTWNTQPSHTSTQLIQSNSQMPSNLQYSNGQLIASSPGKTVLPIPKPTTLMSNSTLSPDKMEKERMKKMRQAEAARLRYHRLSAQAKRELNLKRTMAQKRKRQREKEMEELDSILRETNDIQEDPDITEQLREKRMRAKWAEAARQRYARMTPDERRAHNNRRRQRQMQNALNAVKAAGGTGDPLKDEEAVRNHIKMQNAKKAEAARMRYHRMTDEEKRMYNQRRTEAFRRRRMEEEMLLAMPIGRINGEALDRAQQIVVRNAKRAEAARARYQRMTPDQRKNYNQKRYTPKRRSGEMGGMLGSIGKKEEMDVLTTLEREVMKRTQQAQQALKRQQGAAAAQQQQQMQSQSGTTTPGPSQQSQNGSLSGTYIINPAPQQTVTHIPQSGGVQIQLTPGGTHQQVVHVSHHMQPIQTQGHTIITQQQGFNNPLPTSQSHVVVHNSAAPTSGHLVVHHPPPTHQVTYTTNHGGMMISTNQHVQQVQPVQQQVLNPYQTRPQRMNHTVYLQAGVDSPSGADSPRNLEILTSSGASYQSLSAYPPATTYYTAPSTYFSSELPTHHGLRLPSITTSLGSSIIKEHPAAVQADQMNSYMEFCFEQDGQAIHENVGEEVIVDEQGHHLIEEEDDDEDALTEDEIQDSVRYMTAETPSSSRRGATARKRKHQQPELDEILRSNLSNRSEMTKERRAAAARSRYQRMSEAERKCYNQRRRLKALGIDPTTVAAAVTEGEVPPQVKETIKMANAKKAEAARLRYHRMTADEKKEYNARRTESFRKRREEEEQLLATPAGCISPEGLNKAQVIMHRNARKAESARMRYQKMTPAQRKYLKDYNIRRAQSKKTRVKSVNDLMLRDGSISGTDSIANDSLSDPASIGLGTSFSEPPANILEGRPESTVPPPPVQPPTEPSDEIFEQMEREVMKRTKQAKMILDRQQRMLPEPSSRYSEVSDYQSDQVMLNDMSSQIDEGTLRKMLESGRDLNGMEVELLVDGRKITQISQLGELAQGQTIIIAPCGAAVAKSNPYIQTDDLHHLQSIGGSQIIETYSSNYPRYREEFGSSSQMDDPNLLSLAQRHTLAKAKRAERARIRYRNMQPELRQAQNAKRADLLRKARARDEELVQMAETRELTTLPNDLQRAITDARTRRAKRAEQARNKYHRMTSEERRQYNAMRDAQRRQRKRQQEMEKNGIRSSLERQDHMDMNHHHLSNEPSGSNSISPSNDGPLEERVYNEYDIYEHGWEP